MLLGAPITLPPIGFVSLLLADPWAGKLIVQIGNNTLAQKFAVNRINDIVHFLYSI